jgi:hypothetical protein
MYFYITAIWHWNEYYCSKIDFKVHFKGLLTGFTKGCLSVAPVHVPASAGDTAVLGLPITPSSGRSGTSCGTVPARGTSHTASYECYIILPTVYNTCKCMQSVRSWQLERMGWGSNGAQNAAAGTATGAAVSAALGMAARAESTDLP